MARTGDEDRADLVREAVRLKRAAARSRNADLPRRPADAPARLGELQRSLWLLHRMDPGSPAYNLASAFRIRGPIDPDRLQQALDGVVGRHRVLRSTFEPSDDDAVQVIHPESAIPLEIVDGGDGSLEDAVTTEARKPFNLHSGPLVRMVLVESRDSDDRILLLVLHHILADERSLAILWDEIADAYRGQASADPVAIQYDDYIHWLAGQDRDDRTAMLKEWRERLTPLPDELRLPFEAAEAASTGARGRLLTHSLPAKVHAEIRELAAAVGTTPFMVFAFAFRLLLHRYTNGRPVAFATPATMRSHPVTARMIGYFLNPVVVPTGIDEEQPVERAVGDFSAALRELLASATVPFEVLAQAIAPPREMDRHPVFQAMFVYQEAIQPPQLDDGVQLEPVTLDLGESKFDLTLFVSEGSGALEVAVEYRADRFDEVWMRNLLDHYAALIKRLPERPERITADVSVLSDEDSAGLRAVATGSSLDLSRVPTLPQQIAQHALLAPESIAAICAGEAWTYERLARTAHGLARELRGLGVGPGDRIGLYVERSPAMIAGALGIQWIGAAYVPLDPAYPAARNHDVLENATVAAVVTTSPLRAALPSGPWRTVAIDGIQPDGAEPIPIPDIALEAPAYVLYTSGSTGQPKGVVVTHDNLRASTAARLEVYEPAPSRYLLLPSVAFDSSVAGIFWTLGAGGALVIPTDEQARDPRQLAELVRNQQVTTLLCVPSLYAHMLSESSDWLGGLDTAIVAGESCSSKLVEEHFRRLPGVRLFNEYGPTEATVWSTVHEFVQPEASQPVSIGRPIPGVRVDVVDELGRAVPPGIPGRAWIAGRTVAEGYWRHPELTAERFAPDLEDRSGGRRKYRSGDLMTWTVDGRLLFLGREDEQIKLRGFRVEPGEVEAALHEQPDVREAAVLVRRTGPKPSDEQLVAFLEIGDSDGAQNRREQLAARLPDFMLPSRFVEMRTLPRLPNGKLDRHELRTMVLESEVTPSDGHDVASTNQQALLSLWEGMLGRFGIGLHDNFFELGGHSLLLVEMTSVLERDFGVALSPAEVFQNPTVDELARRIEQRRPPDAFTYSHLFPIQPKGAKTPLVFCVPHFFSGMLASRFRGERPVYGLRGISLRPEGNLGRWRTMAALGYDLVAEIRQRFGDEKVIVAGYSFGATMAVEMVRLMEERGLPVHRLYLIAPMPVDMYRAGPFRAQLDYLQKPVSELTAGEALRLFARTNDLRTHRPYQRLWRHLAVQPRRRLLCLLGKLRRASGRPLTPEILHADVRVDRFRLHAGYRPGTVTTPTFVFNAREPDTDAAATWRPYFEGPFTTYETPDPHLDEDSLAAAREIILAHLCDLGD